MKRSTLYGRSARRALAVSICAVALTGCDNTASLNPAAPSFQPLTLGPGRSVEIFASLAAEQGSCMEATILYDGVEVPGARAECANANGCVRLDLTGAARTATGRHTISLQVLSQSPEAVDYLATTTILVSRDGSSQSVTLPLEPSRATLRAGQSVRFEVHFQNSLP